MNLHDWHEKPSKLYNSREASIDKLRRFLFKISLFLWEVDTEKNKNEYVLCLWVRLCPFQVTRIGRRTTSCSEVEISWSSLLKQEVLNPLSLQVPSCHGAMPHNNMPTQCAPPGGSSVTTVRKATWKCFVDQTKNTFWIFEIAFVWMLCEKIKYIKL